MAGLAGLFFVIMIVFLAVLVILVVSLWKIFTKAGQPGWAAVIPFYGNYIFSAGCSSPGLLFYFDDCSPIACDCESPSTFPI